MEKQKLSNTMKLHPELYSKCKCGRLKHKKSKRCDMCFRSGKRKQLSRCTDKGWQNEKKKT